MTTKNGSEKEGDKIIQLENSLWDYACKIYSQLGVEAALLALQDNHGADINLILQALWLASEGQQWTKACIPNDYDQWMEEQVLPLRQMRRNMKVEWPQQAEFRQQVKKLELKAEQYALGMLFACCDITQESQEELKRVDLQLLGQEMNILAEHFDRIIDLIQ